MATRDAAAIVKWQKALGTLEVGKRADLIAIEGKDGDPYEALIKAKETSIQLVMINGVARYGAPDLMEALGAKGEAIKVGGSQRQVFLQQATGDPDVVGVSLSAARRALKAAFRDLPKLAKELEKPKPIPKKAARAALDAPQPVVWSLSLDEIQPTGVDLRPRLPFNGPRDFTGPARVAPRAAAPLSRFLSRLRSIRSLWRTIRISWGRSRASLTCPKQSAPAWRSSIERTGAGDLDLADSKRP